MPKWHRSDAILMSLCAAQEMFEAQIYNSTHINFSYEKWYYLAASYFSARIKKRILWALYLKLHPHKV